MPILNRPDVDIHYETFGSGPAILFLAATAWSGAPWKLHQVPAFSPDHQVIVFDQRGTGKSVVRTKDFSTKRLVEDAVALLDHLGVEKAIVCGHSNGGRVAQLLAIEFPERVSKLILLSAGATHSSKGIPIKMCLELVEKGYEGHIRDGAIATGCTAAFYASRPDVVEGFLKTRMANLPPLEDYLGHVIGRAESDTTSRLNESARLLSWSSVTMKITAPPPATPISTSPRFWRAIFAAPRLVVMPGEGHHYPFYSPEKTNKVIREFLMAN